MNPVHDSPPRPMNVENTQGGGAHSTTYSLSGRHRARKNTTFVRCIAGGLCASVFLPGAIEQRLAHIIENAGMVSHSEMTYRGSDYPLPHERATKPRADIRCIPEEYCAGSTRRRYRLLGRAGFHAIKHTCVPRRTSHDSKDRWRRVQSASTWSKTKGT